MRVLVLVAIVTFCVACQTPAGPASDTQLDLCDDLGWASYVIGEYKARGDTRSQQILWANRDVETRDARLATLRIIHLAYALDRDPIDLGTGIIRSCRVRDDRAAEIDLEALL